MAQVDVAPFSVSLREWRGHRRLSQLQLATAAATTSRHLSFLETGRSRPTRTMVLRLAAALDLPLRARNDLLMTAGFAPAFPRSDLGTAELAPFRDAIDRLLAQHEPFPAFVVDGRWDVVDANAAARRLLVGGERNLVRLVYGGTWQPLLDNWSALAPAGVRRLEAELQRHPGDTRLRELLAHARAACDGDEAPDEASDELVLCPHFRFGDTVVRTLSVVARFGSARDVTLDELRVELVFPADDDADAFFRSAAMSQSAAGDALISVDGSSGPVPHREDTT
ncbi:helix-turn-helix domain-containing protein [Cellulomonas carbonis]|uniref:XRE family transcriptional regulator n=1 Tax=Cellulomonas carbonis T26 TaxID=947969 RepID=A0A0A0BPL9_9CELL|nr:helix-turn-helix transcriptional regulator [Cellulomonas carbonis]KGM09607.1 XRE family transcriptional regulator [Cellulomonas carbonis T26]GGB94879.1 transcriptional regulator [Cellulomonas carbonis]